jgi:tetratricopeptide (TPR) repeat protein
MKSRSHCLILSLLVCAVFGNSLLNGFVWDDYFYLVNNRVYADFNLARIWLSLANGVEYLPVRDMSYALDYAIWGNNPLGFHLTNVVLYGITTVTCYWFVRALVDFFEGERTNGQENGDLFPFLAAALFAIHPLHSEIVSFITCRNALLSTLLFVVACYANLLFLREQGSRAKACYAAGLGCFVLSLLAKATSITLPFVLLLLYRHRYKNDGAKAVILAIPYVGLSVAALYLHTAIARQSYIFASHNKTDAHAILAKIAVAVQIPWFYLQKLLLPVGLSVEYDTRFAESMVDARVILCLALLGVAISLAVRWRNSKPFESFCLGWYFITLIPVANLFSTHPVVADRYVYLPSWAFFCVLAGLLLKSGKRKASLGVAVGLILLWGGLSVMRNMVWQSNKTLWEDTVRVSPGSTEANVHIGRICFIEGKYEQAFGYFDTARRLNFGSPEYDYFRGYLALVRQDYREATVWFGRSLARDPQFIEALYAQGKAYEGMGAHDLALEYYRRVLQSPEPDIVGLKPLAQRKMGGTGGR